MTTVFDPSTTPLGLRAKDSPDDILLWPDGTWCYRKRASDPPGEYVILYKDTDGYKLILARSRCIRTPTWSLSQ